MPNRQTDDKLFLQGSAAGLGVSNGSFKGHRLFTCPDACALFLPVSHVQLRHWTRSNGAVAHERVRERDYHRSNSSNHPTDVHHSNSDRTNHQQQNTRHVSVHQRRSNSPSQLLGFIPRTAESAPVSAQSQVQVRSPTSPPPYVIGQRICYPEEDIVQCGEVRFCGLLPGRSSSGMYVGVLLVSIWDINIVELLRIKKLSLIAVSLLLKLHVIKIYFC